MNETELPKLRIDRPMLILKPHPVLKNQDGSPQLLSAETTPRALLEIMATNREGQEPIVLDMASMIRAFANGILDIIERDSPPNRPPLIV